MDLANVKLLVVGAGGIGCELLKNLVLTGFSQIEVIDLDTIELSNLNRQFLFQKQHVGKPKAIIARESVLRYNPNANIIAYHDSIMNVKYNVEYFKQFNLVLNALDNKAARSHVNRLCLAADVPLIESGSAGYLGQVTLIKKNFTECYDCLPKPPAKTFPGCTIRNTPSEPIHCIVWAKHLFNQLFGAEDPDEAVSPDGEDPENMAEAGQIAIAKSSTDEIVTRISTRQWAKETNYDSAKLFNKLFNDDIKYLLSMAKLWEKRRPPTPLDWSQSVNNETCYIDERQSNSNKIKGDRQVENSDSATKLAAHKIWSISECCKVFNDSVNALHKKLDEAAVQDSTNPILCWDKDDEDAMNFVTSAANLRCYIFGIAVRSKFEVKSLAGNIIPAIATTNAIVAGLIVLQALKVLNNKINECKTVYLRDKATLNKLIVTGQLVKPNPKCYVCASKPEISVRLNLNTFTVKNFETKILKQELNMVQPDVEIDDGTGRIIISSEEGETEENNDKTLSVFGLTDHSSLKCDDFFQNYELKIILYHCEKFDTENTKEYEIIADSEMLKELQDQMNKPTTSAAVLDNKQEEKKDTLVAKRSYDAAFEGEEDSSTITESKNEEKRKSFKKMKSSSNNTSLNEITTTINNNSEESNSINDASDAISDEDLNNPNDELIVHSKETNSTKRITTVFEEITVDDDCIIEENSNEMIVRPQGNINNDNKNHQNKNQAHDDDDDVIECSSDEEEVQVNGLMNKNNGVNHQQNGEDDIIEINEDDESNDNNNHQNGKHNNNSNSNHHLNGNNFHHQNSCNSEYTNGTNEDNHIKGSKMNLLNQEEDSVTVIE